MLGGIYRFGSGGATLSNYRGTWDANANNPHLSSGVGNPGDWYIVSVAGNTNLDGITDWDVGDWAVFNGNTGTWQKIDNTDQWIEDTYGIHYPGGRIGIGTNSNVNRAISILANSDSGILGETTTGDFSCDFIGKQNVFVGFLAQDAASELTLRAATSANVKLYSGSGDSFLSLSSTSGSAYVYIDKSSAPGSVLDKLYNISGVLYWNGYPISAGALQWVEDTNGIHTDSIAIGIGTDSSTSYSINAFSENSNAGIKLRSSNSSVRNDFIAEGNSITYLEGGEQAGLEVKAGSNMGFVKISSDTDSAFLEITGLSPADTSNKLYNDSGTLYWNGNPVSTGTKFSITLRGIAVSANNLTSFAMPVSGTIGKVYAKVGTAPTGADLRIDVNKNGSSIFSSPEYLTISAGETTGNKTPSISSISVGDVITIDIDQVGSTIPGGEDLWIWLEVS